MEIGVADGENARNMMKVTIRNFSPEEEEYYGFDLFGGDDDFRLKQVRWKLKATEYKSKLFKGDSVKTLPKTLKTLPKMDLIFIGGGHSYPTVNSDWKNSKSPYAQRNRNLLPQLRLLRSQKMVNNISREKYKVKIIHPKSDYDTALVKKKV
jgi:hypothetical protein